MTAFTLGEAAALAVGRVRPVPRTTSSRPQAMNRSAIAPVRRGSLEAGSFEDGFFTTPAVGETDRLLRTARAALDAGRRLKRAARAEGRPLSVIERALAGLSAGAIRVYEELLTLARLNRGRVYPSYDGLARATALGRATVARALGTLETAGFLVRQRRFTRIVGEGAGPRYAQASNVYRPVAPRRLMSLLPRWLRPAPVPDDALQHAAIAAHETAAMRATLSCRELAQASVGGALGQVLARFGALLDTRLRESHDGSEQLLQFTHPNPLRRSGTPSHAGQAAHAPETTSHQG